MLNLGDISALLDETTQQLSQSTTLTPQAGISLIDQWIIPLGEAENTKDFASQLQELKTLLTDNPEDSAVQTLLARLADGLTEFSSQVGPEGELPSLMTGLASALRQVGGTSAAENT